jgi:hypothetical protein
VNCSCSKRWFCLTEKSSSISDDTSSSISTPTDDVSMKDYCETSLDDIVNLKTRFTFDNLSYKIKRTRSNGYIKKKKKRSKQRQTKSCCLAVFFNSTKQNPHQKKKDLTFTQQILAPIVTLKDLISTSFSISSSSPSLTSDEKTITPIFESTTSPINRNETPQLSCKSLSFDPSLSIISTPKSFLVHSYTSLSNYRIKSNLLKHEYSLEEQIHNEECLYCSNENALTIKTDPNNNHFEQISLQSINLFHAIEMYLSSNNSSHDLFDLSSISSEHHLSMQETKQLSLCEINEIIYAIHSDIENDNERNQILDSLATSLRQVAEEIPVVLQEEQTIPPPMNIPEPPPPPPGLGQILARAVMYEIVMKLFSFYILLLMCYGHL